jgi:hypothetical protein
MTSISKRTTLMQEHLKSSHLNSINESDHLIVREHSKKSINQKINPSENASIVTLSLIQKKNVDSNF